MRIAVIATYTHPTRKRVKEPSVMQSAVPELIAGLCPEGAQVEIFNEKEVDVPLDRHWDLVFFSYLHSYYEHTKVLSTLFRQRGMVTVAGGRHAGHFTEDVQRYFDAVIVGEPEPNVPALIRDFERKELRKLYNLNGFESEKIQPYRYELIDYSSNRMRLPGIEATRGCPFTCNFCVLTGHEPFRYRPIDQVISEIRHRMSWNPHYFGLLDDAFIFLDNNLGGSPRYLRELCEALVPLKKTWGCALTYNILMDQDLVHLMARAGCRYIYTGLESLDPEAIRAMNKRQNRLSELNQVIQRVHSAGILLSFGLIVGSDGDTNDYLERLPGYLADLRYFSVTFLGIVCPYPETPFFRQLQADGRLLPDTISRDYDGYTLCHRPRHLEPSEVVEHFVRLCNTLGSLPNLARHYWSKLAMSAMPRYKSTIFFSGPEILSIRRPVKNLGRTFIAGRDAIEAWDDEMLRQLRLPTQRLT